MLDLLPAPTIETIEGIQVVRDDRIPGGTKRRVLDRIVADFDADEFVYASPAYGYAQVALAYSCRVTGKKATVFVAKRKQMHPRTLEAQEAGAQIVQIPHGYLSNIQAKARAYCEETGAELMPFGLDFPRFVDGLARVAMEMDICPREVWTVAGSGVLTRALQQAWPDARFHAVQIGCDPNAGGATIWKAPEKFERDAKIVPPFPSCSNYDAKAWQFIREWAAPGALFWNVAA